MNDYACGYQPLHYAAYCGHLNMVKLLIEQESVDLNSRTDDGCTALFLAAQQGHLAVIKYLLDTPKGAAKLNIGAQGFSPIVSTSHRYYLTVVGHMY